MYLTLILHTVRAAKSQTPFKPLELKKLEIVSVFWDFRNEKHIQQMHFPPLRHEELAVDPIEKHGLDKPGPHGRSGQRLQVIGQQDVSPACTCVALDGPQHARTDCHGSAEVEVREGVALQPPQRLRV